MSIRGKATAVTTTAALAALTGVALNSNKGMQAPAPAPAAAASKGAPIVTRTSGPPAASQPIATPVPVKRTPQPMILTRASGGGVVESDD